MSGSQRPLNGADSEPVITPVQKAYNIIHALDERLEIANNEYEDIPYADIQDILDDLHEAEMVLESAGLAIHDQGINGGWDHDTMGADL
jgi:hypothetical protein